MRVLALLLFTALHAVAQVDPDFVSTPVRLGAGTKPHIQVDDSRGVVHLIYGDGGNLMYRTGDHSGSFGEPETVMSLGSGLNSPVMKLDADGVPHVIATTGTGPGASLFYSNRIGGTWKRGFLNYGVAAITSQECQGADNGDLAIDADGAVFIAAYTRDPRGTLVRIDDAATAPVVGARYVDASKRGMAAFVIDNELWVFSSSNPYIMRKHNKSTLQPEGSAVTICDNRKGQQARGLADHAGDFHFGGASYSVSADKAGWYNSLSRARNGQSKISFRSNCDHECGAILPVADRMNAGRVYCIYISGETDNGAHTSCASNDRLRLTRIEDGTVVTEHKALLAVSVGPHYRTNPCGVAALPGGGVMVVYATCQGPELQMVLVGADWATSVHEGAVPTTNMTRPTASRSGNYSLMGQLFPAQRWRDAAGHAAIVSQSSRAQPRRATHGVASGQP